MQSYVKSTNDKSLLVPNHVAIIMDGNGRWASMNNRPHTYGHRAGAKRVKPIVKASYEASIRNLTLFAFSTENWLRPKAEVSLLLDLMRETIKAEIDELSAQGIRISFIGNRSRFPLDLQHLMNDCVEQTSHNDHMLLTIAVNYGGHWDISNAARELAAAVRRGELLLDECNEQTYSRYLSLANMPPPDLCIRTGGDQRLSNFLLWDLAYTELYFTQVYWPDFTSKHLKEALHEYTRRDRRFGLRTVKRLRNMTS